jgi:hypothetical protein
MKIAIALAIALALSSLALMTVQSVMAALDRLPGAGQFAPGNQFFHGGPPTDPSRFSVGHQFDQFHPAGTPGQKFINSTGGVFGGGGVSTGPG